VNGIKQLRSGDLRFGPDYTAKYDVRLFERLDVEVYASLYQLGYRLSHRLNKLLV